MFQCQLNPQEYHHASSAPESHYPSHSILLLPSPLAGQRRAHVGGPDQLVLRKKSYIISHENKNRINQTNVRFAQRAKTRKLPCLSDYKQICTTIYIYRELSRTIETIESRRRGRSHLSAERRQPSGLHWHQLDSLLVHQNRMCSSKSREGEQIRAARLYAVSQGSPYGCVDAQWFARHGTAVPVAARIYCARRRGVRWTIDRECVRQ